MKKLMLFIFVSAIMIGCSQQEIADSIGKYDFGVFTYDSCEYLIGIHGYNGFLAHKGDCKFCKERRQKELEELVIKLKEK